MRRTTVATMAGLIALAIGGASFSAVAEEAFPNKPVKIIVGMPAGSFTDLSARLIGEGLRTNLGGSVVIENRPGAATNIATGAVARSPKDGYTLLLASNSNTMNVSLFKELPFDITKDFVPVAMIASTAFVLVVNPSVAANNLKELIAHAKSNPGELNFASTGSGTANHLAIDTLAQRAGIKVTTVFYKGSPDAIADLIAGRVQAMFAPASTSMPHVKAGKLKALAFSGATRTALAPDVPTMIESGLPGYEIAMWNGLFAPAGTPKEVIERLAAAATKAVGSAELQSKIRASGGDPVVMGPREFADYIAADIRRWSEAIAAAGIKPH